MPRRTGIPGSGKSRTTWLALALVMGSAMIAGAYPEPAIVPRAWQFDIQVGRLQPISIRDMHGHVRWYWYLPYKVTNKTGQERLFIPEVTVATDEGDIVEAGRNIPGSVFEAIARRERNPLLLSPIDAVGRLLQGEDFAKESVAIWPAFDHAVGQINVFFAGLSGEVQSVSHPLTDEPVLMRKTYMVHFATPGSHIHPQELAVIPRGDEWVMR